MSTLKKSKTKEEKLELHPRNKFRESYDFKALIKSCPELAAYVKVNEHQIETIDFFNAKAVKTLNKALLKYTYNIVHWDIPNEYLCPPVPGRSDYIHFMADVLALANNEIIPIGNNIKGLDVGVGANCIYPIIGHQEYGWNFVGSEVDANAMHIAKKIIDTNKNLKGTIELRKQNNLKDKFKSIIQKNEYFDFSICNPPFYTSLAEAHGVSKRKVDHLKKADSKDVIMNFSGQKNELWCSGGEANFIETMILESKEFEHQVFWFSSLVAKENHLKRPYELLKKLGATTVHTIKMAQGNKISRILVWTFLDEMQRKKWIKERWQ